MSINEEENKLSSEEFQNVIMRRRANKEQGEKPVEKNETGTNNEKETSQTSDTKEEVETETKIVENKKETIETEPEIAPDASLNEKLSVVKKEDIEIEQDDKGEIKESESIIVDTSSIEEVRNEIKEEKIEKSSEKDVEAITQEITLESDDSSEDDEKDPLESYNDRFSLSDIESEEDVEVNIDVEETEEKVDNPSSLDKSSPIKIGSTGDRKSIKRLSKLNPGPNVKVVEDDEYQMAVIEQYITGQKGGVFVGPKSISRVILPYSGIYYDISSYTNSDMLSIHRSTSEISFIEKVEAELYSAWEHTVSNSFKRKLDFVEWLRNIKYPDLWCIYWGIYNVNHPGINSYTSRCDECPNIIKEDRDNYNISYVSEYSKEDITQKEIDDIRKGVDREFIKSYKIASTLIEKEGYLPDQNFKVFQGMPNMEEVITFLKYLKTDRNEEDDIIRRVLYPISWLDLERNRLSKSAITKILAYKYIMFTRKIYVPVYEEIKNVKNEVTGKPKIKVTYVNVKSIMIPPLIDGLSKDDFKALIKGKELRKVMVKDGIHFRVKDSVCPKCKKKQLVTVLDMRDILFTRAAEMTEFLTSI